MRILIVCTDAEIGGAERFLASLANARDPQDSVGLVVLMKPGSLSDQLEKSFSEVHYLGFGPDSRNLPGMVRALERVVEVFAPDIVSSHLFHADLVVALARISVPRTTTVHTQHLGPDDHILTRAIARAVGLLSFRFQAVIPASASPQMANFIQTLKMKRVVPAIPNGANVPAEPAFDPRARQFLSLARNHPVKGHARLFAAFAAIADKHPEWNLVAYGPGVTQDDEEMRGALEEAGATRLVENNRICLKGPTGQPESVLAASAALVISSIYGEAFPIVGAEAAGLGIPVITTDLGSCAEFADDSSYLVPADDAEALAEALDRFAQSSNEERQRLSELARQRAESQYDPSIVFQNYRSLFERLIKQSKAGSR